MRQRAQRFGIPGGSRHREEVSGLRSTSHGIPVLLPDSWGSRRAAGPRVRSVCHAVLAVQSTRDAGARCADWTACAPRAPSRAPVGPSPIANPTGERS